MHLGKKLIAMGPVLQVKMWMACSYGLTAVGFYSTNRDIVATEMMVGVDSVQHCYNRHSHWFNVSTALDHPIKLKNS